MKKSTHQKLAVIGIFLGFLLALNYLIKETNINDTFYRTIETPEKVCNYEYNGKTYHLYLGDTKTYYNGEGELNTLYEFVSFSGISYDYSYKQEVNIWEFDSLNKTASERAISNHKNLLERIELDKLKRIELINNLKCD
jgi:hypothetical protein